MKLILAIVNNEDSAVVASALTKADFKVTKLSTTGGFLMMGNTTFLIGTEDDRVEHAKDVIRKHSQTRVHPKPAPSFGGTPADAEMITVGGATVMVLNIENMEKY